MGERKVEKPVGARMDSFRRDMLNYNKQFKKEKAKDESGASFKEALKKAEREDQKEKEEER